MLKLLVAEGTIGEHLSQSMLAWRYIGFPVHNRVRVHATDAAGRMKLAQYTLRAPMSLEKMNYFPDTAMVMYRSHMHKGLKRNFQLMPAAQWLEMLSRHIPDRYEHLVRYGGWYSTRCRGERARASASQAAVQAPEDGEVIAARARSAWAQLIHKVYEVDPLVQGAVKCYATDKNVHDLGESFVILRGGMAMLTGRQSEIQECSIIMSDGADPSATHYSEALLTNWRLVVRDRLACAYYDRVAEDSIHPGSHPAGFSLRRTRLRFISGPS
ncbi:MAG: transposase [Betaproteobacteria bacterium]|nr:transposase [Betaproteobacteria bacterium]